MDLISVIIPLYNAERFVEKAYTFITNQKDLKIPFEIIFVDNNSVDNSYQIASEIASRDERVKVFKEQMQGAPSARNKGFLESKGNYLYFFDVDDQLFEDALSSLSNVLIKKPEIDSVFGKLLRSKSGIELIDRSQLQETENLTLYQKPYWGLLWFKDLSKTIGPPGFLYRRKVFEELGMYNTKIPGSEDTALDINLGMKYNVAFIDKYVYLYFKHESATTTVIKKKKSRAFMQWPRLIHSHIPYHLKNKGDVEYHSILNQKIYTSIAKMIHETNSVSERKSLRKQLIEDIKPLKLPFLLANLIRIMVVVNSSYLFKFYVYYLMPLYLDEVNLENYQN